MKSLQSKKSGFTLIEIIIVVIIIGILASLALPAVSRNIRRGEAMEAVNLAGTVRRSAIDCVQIRGDADFTNCDSWASIGVDDLSAASERFTYTLDDGGTPGELRLLATHDSSGDTLTMTATGTDAADVTWAGTGDLTSIAAQL